MEPMIFKKLSQIKKHLLLAMLEAVDGKEIVLVLEQGDSLPNFTFKVSSQHKTKFVDKNGITWVKDETK